MPATPPLDPSEPLSESATALSLRNAMAELERRGDFGKLFALVRAVESPSLSPEIWEMVAMGALFGYSSAYFDLAEKAALSAPLNAMRGPAILGVAGKLKPQWVGRDPMSIAISRPGDVLPVLRFLARHGCDGRPDLPDGLTPLMVAAAVDDPQTGLARIEFIAPLSDLNAVNSRGRNALMIAAEAQNWPCVSKLLDMGGDPKAVDPEGNTLFLIALRRVSATYNNGPLSQDVIDVLLRLGRACDWRAANRAGETAATAINSPVWAIFDQLAIESGIDGVQWVRDQIMKKFMPQSAAIANAHDEAQSLLVSMAQHARPDADAAAGLHEQHRARLAPPRL